MIKESIFNAGVERNQGLDKKQEDKLNKNELDFIDQVIDKFCNEPNIGDNWEIEYSLDEFLNYFKEKCEEAGYDYQRLKKYIQDNWTMGKQICDIVNPYPENVKESIFNAGVERNQGNEIKKEDEFNEDDRQVLDTYIEIFSNEVALGNGEYQETLDDFIAYIKDFQDKPKISKMNPDIPKIVKFVKMNWSDRENICEIISDKVDNVREEYGGDDVNESIFNAGVERNQGNDIKNEDKLDEVNLKALNKYIEKFTDKDSFDGYKNVARSLTSQIFEHFRHYILKYRDLFEYMEEYEGYDVKTILQYVDDNWDKGMNIKNVILKKVNIDESIFNAGVERNQGNEIKKEDEMNEHDNIVLYNLINMFRLACKHGDSYIIEVNSFEKYIRELPKSGFKNFDMEKTIKYIKTNWDDIEKKLKNINECDCVSPNGGLTFGDVAGMGPITFPGECGERGSGDLPMPSGKVYRQVAPFSSFIKIKKKKRKKFSKKDEPCAQYDNPPIYNHVDDFRDYVERTYNQVNKIK